MDEIGVVSPELLREIVQDYLARKQLHPHVQNNYPQRRQIDNVSPHRVLVKNTEAESIPPYACMRIIGTETVAGRTALTVEKPTSIDGEFVFNSQFEIAVDGTGWAYRYGIVVMLGDGTPPTSANVQYSPVVSSWEITESAGPFVVFGENVDATDALIGRLQSSGPSIVHAIVTADLGGGYFTVELAEFVGDEIGCADCDPCDIPDSESELCGEILLTYRASQLEGLGVSVTARDVASQLVPLVIPSDCLIVNLGDTIDSTPIWQIVRGLQNHLVTYEEDWSCCDGVDETGVTTLLSRTPLILIGKRCAPVECGTCVDCGG